MPTLSWQTQDPNDCQSMADVRTGVDEIDRILVTILVRRQAYMDAAARIKPQRQDVYDQNRINQVIQNVKEEASIRGLDWSIAEPVWRELVAQCIEYELRAWDKKEM